MQIFVFLNCLQKLSRNRNRYIAKQQQIKKNNKELLEMSVVNELDNDNMKSSHTLIELSDTQWKRYENNSIVVSGLIEDKSRKNNLHIKYKNIHVGKHLQFKKRTCVSFGKVLRSKTVLLKNTCSGYLMIVGRKDEHLEYNPNLTIIDGSSQQGAQYCNTKKHLSGFLIIFLGRIQRQVQISKYVWGKKETNMLKSCKPNIIQGSASHYGSSGKYYSFGARANYGKIDQSTLTRYVAKKFKSPRRSMISQMDAKHMEYMAGKELSQSINYLSKLIPNLHLFISPTLSVVHKLQEEIGECNVVKIEGSDSGLWTTSICVTCQTEILHTEDDFTYTVISIPEQEQTAHEPFFMFELMDKYTLGIKMEAGLSFIFSGKYLTHRQVIPDSTSKQGNFINVASYGNKRLYNHIKSTVRRVMD